MRKSFVSSFLVYSSILGLTMFGCSSNTDKPSSNAPVNNQKSVLPTEEIVPLEFQPVTTKQEVRKLEKSTIQEVVKEKEVDHGKAFIFKKRNDSALYGGYQRNQILFDLGKIGDQTYLEITSIKKIEFQEKSVLRIQGGLGADYPQTNYYLIESGVPKPFLQTDGHTLEQDLDQDGLQEVVASEGTPTLTSIYKLQNSHFSVANVNKALNALSVLPKKDDTLLFEAYYKNEAKPKTFVYTKQGMKQIFK